MLDTGFGIDITGFVDRSAYFHFASRNFTLDAKLPDPVVVALGGFPPQLVAGIAATVHPIDRGWPQPKDNENDGKRHFLSDLLNGFGGKDDIQADDRNTEILGAHLRHLIGGNLEAGLGIPDDLDAAAQTAILESARKARRFNPKTGWRSWEPRPLWRSVATVFGWANRLPEDQLQRYRQKEILVLSFLADRLIASQLTFDLSLFEGRLLATPIRSKPAACLDDPYPPIDLEEKALEFHKSDATKRQIRFLNARKALAINDLTHFLVQDPKGRWERIQNRSAVTGDDRRHLMAEFRDLLKEAIKTDASLILLESPDPDRGFKEPTWIQEAQRFIRNYRPNVGVDVCLATDSVSGAAEYSARLFKGAPTFFDYLPEIKINALDDEIPKFIPLLAGQKRVKGNETFRDSLSGKFVVHARSSRLQFYISREGDPTVRKSIVLIQAPEALVPITLKVEQRPVSGHAHIEVVPDNQGELGNTRIELDWKLMENTGKTEEQILQQLKREAPSAFPNSAPLPAHWAVWKHLGIVDILKRYLQSRLELNSRSYSEVVTELLKSLRQTVNPARVHIDREFNRQVRAFTSDGEFPPGSLFDRGADLAKTVPPLWEEVKARVNQDIRFLYGRRTISENAMRILKDLCLASAWTYSSAAEEALKYLRLVAKEQVPPARFVESMGRAFSTEEDVKLALKFVDRSLRKRRQRDPPWTGATNDLKAVTSLLQLRPDSALWITTSQANLILECASHILRREAKETSAFGAKVLSPVLVILLLMRHRKADNQFLSPPVPEEEPSVEYRLVEQSLLLTQAEIDSGRRAHALLRQVLDQPGAVNQALLFLRRTGGNPDIIGVIDSALTELDELEPDDNG